MKPKMTGGSSGEDRSAGSSFEYEHFPVVCPTCQGLGEICDDDDAGLVTFVPVKDDRLKPAWTKLKVATLVLFLTTAGGLTSYFLYPRSVKFHVSAHNILNFNFEGDIPWMQYSFDVTVKNNNFFPVTLTDINMNLIFREQTIVKQPTSDIHVSLRSEIKTLVLMNATYDDLTTKRFLRKQCYEERDYVGQLMQTSGELDYWVHSEHIESRDDYFYTDCGSLIFPLVVKTTLKPTTTTTTTTPTTTLKPTATTTTTTATVKTKLSTVYSTKSQHETTMSTSSKTVSKSLVQNTTNTQTASPEVVRNPTRTAVPTIHHHVHVTGHIVEMETPTKKP